MLNKYKILAVCACLAVRISADEQPVSASPEPPARSPLAVRCQPLPPAKRVYKFDKGHRFESRVKVLLPDGTPQRRLTSEHFSFAVDGRLGRTFLKEGESFLVEPDYQDLDLEVDVLIEGGPATRLMAMESRDGVSGDIQSWLAAFISGLPAGQWALRLWAADGPAPRLVRDGLRDAGAVRDALHALSERGDMQPSENLAAAMQRMQEDYTFFTPPENIRPRILLVFSSREGLRDQTGVLAAVQQINRRELPALAVLVGSDTPGNFMARAPTGARAMAEKIFAMAAPYYIVRVHLHGERLEPDRRNHAFAIKVLTGRHAGISNIVPFSPWAGYWPLWMIVIVAMGALVIIVLLVLSFILMRSALSSISSRNRERPGL